VRHAVADHGAGNRRQRVDEQAGQHAGDETQRGEDEHCRERNGIGLFSRAVTIPIIGFLSIAFFIHHAHDRWQRRELALVYLIPFVALFFLGPGKFALDAWIKVKVASKGGD